ncbi:Retrovirus-related Pol polyprotein from transposon opus [Exaiptasia diaphana]|nr:Retrovirus-related Pol polyprotein from transposon opus [Exaiptasia diaphana]
MASWQISPPEKFEFGKPELWPKWRKRFDRFRVASGLDKKDGPSQINALIYSMGERADDIFNTFTLTEEEEESYDAVVEKFQSHFVKKRNPIFERAKFNQRVQLSGESVDSFITDLHSLSEHCAYGTLTDELIRDRLVVGLRDAKLSEKLQMNSELTLAKAMDQARLDEAIKKQQSVVRGNTTQTGGPEQNVEFIQRKKFQKKKNPTPQVPDNKKSDESKCNRCGKSPTHPRQECPAKNATCHKCKKKGHFKSVCKFLCEVCEDGDDDDDDDEEFFLGSVHVDELKSEDTYWNANVKLQDLSVNCKIDTGADVTVVPEHIFKKTGCKLLKTNANLSGPNQQKLDVCGMFEANISYKEQSSMQKVYVVRGLKRPLLGRPAIEALNIVSFVNAVFEKDDVVKRYPKLFTGLGKLETAYHIELEKDAKPYALFSARRIALPQLPKVRKELERLESLGVISKVEVPTDWCAPIVVVPKQNGQVRICVDLTRLNDSVKRERHILPSVEETLAQLGGAKVFSKLDANSGFHQIPLTEESKLLTTFITPFGRYCYNRLPFGITSAPEHFQKRMSSILSNEEGTVNMIDDTLVFGRNQQEHDERLHKVLKRIEAAGITLNLDKCEFAKTEVTFLGHVVDSNGIRPDPSKIKAIKDMAAPENIHELRRFLGMANQLSKFTSKLTETSKPLRDLLSTKRVWAWGSDQQQAFEKLKELLTCESAVLAHYDPQRETRVSADASAYGLGAVLEQQQDDMSWRPVVYHSRSMSSCEQRYAQIEKEALGVTWACERFSSYLIGKKFEVLTDHKPLVSLLGSKDLDTLPPRIQRFRMRMMRFHYSIKHIPEKRQKAMSDGNREWKHQD